MPRFLTLLALGTLLPAVALAGPSTVVFQTSWPVRTGLFPGPFDVAVTLDGTVLVSDLVEVNQFTTTGTYLGKWQLGPVGINDHGTPGPMATDGLGNVYIPSGFGYVAKLTTSGTQLVQWRLQQTTAGISPDAFEVAVGSDGNVFVTDPSNRNVQKFSPTGQFLLRWGSEGAGPGQFYTAQGVAADRAGHIFVTDSGTNCRVQVFDLNGNFLYQFGSYGSGDGQFEQPTSMAFDEAGNLVISDEALRQVIEFRPDGTFVGVVASHGTGPGQVQYPAGIGTDHAGNVYVADIFGATVEKFVPAAVPAASATWGQVKAIYHGDRQTPPRAGH